jgi:hypothetical protein
MVERGKYRWRYSLRTLMPWSMVEFFPKGKRDCGNHIFYKDTDEVDRCLYCRVGERCPSQFP